jgi:hypothetical protein
MGRLSQRNEREVEGMIDYTTIELELIFEEVAKLPRTTDTSYWVPDVLELVRQRIFYYECSN